MLLPIIALQVLEKPKVTREGETPESENNADRINATNSQPSTLQVCEMLNLALCLEKSGPASFGVAMLASSTSMADSDAND